MRVLCMELGYILYSAYLWIHYGSAMIIRAFSPIKKGEQCFKSYGITFSEHEQQSRKERLRQEDFYSIRMRSHKEIMVANRNLSLLRYNCFVIVLVVELAKNDFRK